MTRALIARMLPAALAFALVTVAAAAGGGYDPSWWGWLAFGPLVVAVTALVVGRANVSRGDVQLVGGLVLFAGWTALALVWTQSFPRTVDELERDLIYVGAAVALVLVRRTPELLLAGVLAATTAIAGESLAGRFVTGGAGRLDGPLIYWNALGILSAAGLLLGLGVAAHGSSRGARSASSAACVVLASALYLTYSRGAVVALAAGLLLLFAFEPLRGRLFAAAAAVAPWCVLGALVSAHAPGAAAAVVVVLLAGAAGIVLERAEGVARRLVVTPRARRRASLAALVLAVSGALAALLAVGGPHAVSARAEASFRSAPSPAADASSKRLLTLSDQGRSEYWRVAWREFRSESLHGTGPGTYELSWHRLRNTVYDTRDAHSLYLEALAETGPLGLTFLLVALSAPLVRIRSIRRHRLGPALLAGYCAILLHAAVDWDWEMPAVMLAALVCAVAAIAAGGPRLRTLARVPSLAGAGALGSLALVAIAVQLANAAESQAAEALANGDVASAAADARRAAWWAPWDSVPPRLLGEAAMLRHNGPLARSRFRQSIRKDPLDWRGWYDLVLVTEGRERAGALAEGLKLNPLEPLVRDLRPPLHKRKTPHRINA